MVFRSLLALSLILTTCQDGIGPVPVKQPTAIGLISEDYEHRVLRLGDTAQVRAYRLDRRGLPIIPDSVRFVWESSDTTVLTVDDSGIATIVGLGEAEVIARLRDISVNIPSPYDTASGRLKLAGMYTVVDPGPVVAAAIANEYMCVIRAGDKAFCRGYNGYGQLGDGSPVPNGFGPSGDTMIWRPVLGDRSYTSISAGAYHACAVTTDQRAFCWGRGHHGQLGNGRRTPFVSSTPLEVTGDHRWLSLDAGGHGATCGVIVADSTPYCFGHNDAGQTGREPIIADDTLVAPIAGSHHMTSILTEHFYTCGLEVDGSVYCSGFWGPPTNTPIASGFGGGIPTRIGGTQILRSIAIGYDHGCGLDAAGAAYCWGYNTSGRLGTGDLSSSGTMRAVLGGLAFRSIHTPETASCGITATGEAWCWGSNSRNALGRTDPALTSSIPLRIGIDAKLKWIPSGDDAPPYSCAITESGQLICWGSGY